MNEKELINSALDRIDGIIVFAKEAQKNLRATTPAPDAPAGVPDGTLVEAVKKMLKGMDNNDYSLDQVYVYLEDALADHEKAGSDGD